MNYYYTDYLYILALYESGSWCDDDDDVCGCVCGCVLLIVLERDGLGRYVIVTYFSCNLVITVLVYAFILRIFIEHFKKIIYFRENTSR